MDAQDERKKPGPVPAGYIRTNISLEPDLLDWGKLQPGGLSELVRRLLKEEKQRQESPQSK